jgi:uncharacterized iron-regulated membrane protein
MKKKNKQLRKIHRSLAPIMLAPIVLTLVTGTAYQMFDLAGQGDGVDWLLDIHKGNFGVLDLQIIYPFLNALGLLVLAVTGISMWLQMRQTRNQREVDSEG